ncbi:hypothetical protein T05_7814 [Trichinella murrelli]|uniref:Uncharacterized protein n=1 Tax=Trichinella murrelli TaxID=144512 RepID=A0A0V0UCX9_9BILA|nr:hypothetical protein T05_7814 [Trichinella murrelli]
MNALSIVGQFVDVFPKNRTERLKQWGSTVGNVEQIVRRRCKIRNSRTRPMARQYTEGMHSFFIEEKNIQVLGTELSRRKMNSWYEMTDNQCAHVSNGGYPNTLVRLVFASNTTQCLKMNIPSSPERRIPSEIKLPQKNQMKSQFISGL